MDQDRLSLPINATSYTSTICHFITLSTVRFGTSWSCVAANGTLACTSNMHSQSIYFSSEISERGSRIMLVNPPAHMLPISCLEIQDWYLVERKCCLKYVLGHRDTTRACATRYTRGDVGCSSSKGAVLTWLWSGHRILL